MNEDYYAVLGVPSNADADTIRKAYRTLIRQWHPDLNPGSQEALQRTIQINRAYDVLSNPARRREYDESRQLTAYRTQEQVRKWRRYQEWRAEELRRRQAGRPFGFRPSEPGASGPRPAGIGCCQVGCLVLIIFFVFYIIVALFNSPVPSEVAPPPAIESSYVSDEP